MSGQRIKLDPAYQRLSLIDSDNKAILGAEKGVRQLGELMESSDNEESVIEIEQQPLYHDEVDHEIEEVGIMAIREVRYVTERQWEKMIAMQKNEKEIMKYLEEISRFEQRHTIAAEIPRNSKGQFIKKQPKEKSDKSKGRRGRPRKEGK